MKREDLPPKHFDLLEYGHNEFAGSFGLDQIWPDMGPLETDEPITERITRTTRIVQRWWRILDGDKIDTTDEISWRPEGVRKEIRWQQSITRFQKFSEHWRNKETLDIDWELWNMNRPLA